MLKFRLIGSARRIGSLNNSTRKSTEVAQSVIKKEKTFSETKKKESLYRKLINFIDRIQDEPMPIEKNNLDHRY